MRLLLLSLLILPFVCVSQNIISEIPRDTSFSVWSSWQKIKKDFPDAEPVKEFKGLRIYEERNVGYYSLGERDLHADLFYPERKSEVKIPAVILIHGGGWASGNKSHLVPLSQMLAVNGFFTATVEHRLSPEAKYPAAITDLKTFVKWLKINAKKYNIDTTKVAVLGCSSGATLASFIGTTWQNPKFKSHDLGVNVSDRVHAIVNIDGIVDFTDTAESGKDDDPAKPSAGARWFGATFEQNPGIWIEASPLTYVDKNTPPTLYINSALERFHAGRDRFLEVLTENQIYSKVYTIENTPHPFWLFHPWFNETWPKILDFLKLVFE